MRTHETGVSEPNVRRIHRSLVSYISWDGVEAAVRFLVTRLVNSRDAYTLAKFMICGRRTLAGSSAVADYRSPAARFGGR